MRLRLTVQRHGLPEARVVWTIDSETATISQLLEQVSEAIPLESGEWGLEDYAVELRGDHDVNFECLHYQLVGKVMKEDDEVVIRPLLSQDIKVRKISGRHQISPDGKHLVDGIAFGRPLLRRPADRPAINIPPRKRRQVTYNEGEDEDEGVLEIKDTESLEKDESDYNEDGNRQLVLHADFEDDDSEDDEDFAPGARDDDDEGEESDDNNEEDDEDEEDESEPDEDYEEVPSQYGSGDKAHHNDENTLLQAKLRKLHSAFPASPIAVCRYVLVGFNEDLDGAYEAMSRGFTSAMPKSAITEAAQGSLSVPKTRSKQTKTIAEESEHQDSVQVELEESTNPLLEYYDQNGLPQGSIMSGQALSHMAEVLTTSTTRTRGSSKGRVASNKSVRFVEENLANRLNSTPLFGPESLMDNSEDGTNEETSSSGDNSSNNELDDEEVSETSSSGTDDDSSDSESSSDSSSDDDSAPEETSSKASLAMLVPANEEWQKTSTETIGGKPASTKSVPPGEGTKQTKTRNLRRRNAVILKKLKEKGILPDDTTTTEFSKLNVDTTTTREEALTALEAVRSATASEVDDEFLARRQQLLASLESGGIEVGQESPRKASRPPPVINDKGPAIEKPEDGVSKEDGFDVSAQSMTATPAQLGDSTTPPSRRARLDLGAGRRLLFGALGIKNPKTKEDEDKLRNDLIKDAGPLFTAKPAEEPVSDAIIEKVDQDPDAWRQSITYRAVECCHDGIELSEPPFPFVQRWDPQQQGARSKQTGQGGKRKKNLRDEPQYYDSNYRASKKQKLRKGKHSYAEKQEYLDDSYEPSYQDDSAVIDYDDVTQNSKSLNDDATSEKNTKLANGLNCDESAGNSQNPADLASLPEDPSTLPDLKAGQATTGITIAFKQLIMSEATKWQPQISPYRTAIVIATPENGELHLTLALRDREQSEKYYDEDTGDRIYGRFDMPVEEEEEPQDDGMLILGFAELIEPKIVQTAPDNLADTTMDDAIPDVRDLTSGLSTANSKGPAEDQFSHITETPLNSEIPESATPARDINPLEEESNFYGQEPGLPAPQSATGKSDVCEQETDLQDPSPNSPERIAGVENVGTPVRRTLSMDVVTESISDEARQEISHMMKDAGFRSSVPSSILKDIRPDGLDSPGDAAVFEKLMKDMTDIENHIPSSPKFDGFGSSSPIRQHGPHSGSFANIRRQFSSSPPPESSWQTVTLDEPSSSPAKAQEEEITQEASDIDPGQDGEMAAPNSHVSKPGKRPSKRKLHMSQSIQRAKLSWEQLSCPTSSQPKVDSPVKNANDLAESSAQDLGGVDGQDSSTAVQYPKLSTGSSFTSQISDHGRQPDVAFDDSAALDIETPSEARSNHQGGGGKSSNLNLPEKSNAREGKMQWLEDPLSREEPEHSGNKSLEGKPEGSEVLADLHLSDDSFPSLEVVFSQREPKGEKSTPVSSKIGHKVGKGHNRAKASTAGRSSGESDHSTPKASKISSQTSRRQASQPSPNPSSPLFRIPEPSSWQAEREKFVLPEGSQVMDLTLSSDVEDDGGHERMAEDDQEQESLEDIMPVFRRYKMADDDDDDYMDSNGKKGRVNKRARNKTEAPKRSATRLRSSSQASPSSRSSSSRRKTVAKF